MNDLAEILRVAADYCHAIDERGGEGLADLFTERAVLDFMGEQTTGREAIAARLSGRGGLVHLSFNPSITIDGDRASGTVDHLLLRREDDGGLAMFLVGRWEDTYAREDGAWRIATRRIATPFGPPKL